MSTITGKFESVQMANGKVGRRLVSALIRGLIVPRKGMPISPIPGVAVQRPNGKRLLNGRKGTLRQYLTGSEQELVAIRSGLASPIRVDAEWEPNKKGTDPDDSLTDRVGGGSAVRDSDSLGSWDLFGFRHGSKRAGRQGTVRVRYGSDFWNPFGSTIGQGIPGKSRTNRHRIVGNAECSDSVLDWVLTEHKADIVAMVRAMVGRLPKSELEDIGQHTLAYLNRMRTGEVPMGTGTVRYAVWFGVREYTRQFWSSNWDTDIYYRRTKAVRAWDAFVKAEQDPNLTPEQVEVFRKEVVRTYQNVNMIEGRKSDFSASVRSDVERSDSRMDAERILAEIRANLTDTEQTVLDMMLQGHSLRTIARTLYDGKYEANFHRMDLIRTKAEQIVARLTTEPNKARTYQQPNVRRTDTLPPMNTKPNGTRTARTLARRMVAA